MRRKTTLMIAAALVLAACGSADETTTTEAAAASTTTSAPATTTTTAPPATTTTVPPTTTTTSTTTTVPPTTTTTTTTTVPPTTTTFVPTHGSDAVGVYLGVVLQDDATGGMPAEFQDAIDMAADMGVFAGYSDLACDQGALEGLGLADGYYNAVSVLFGTMDDAIAFADAYPGDVVGIVAVKTYCLD